MSVRVKQCIVIGLWALLFCAPAILTLVKFHALLPVDENRRKAELPGRDLFTKKPLEYGTKWLAWFDDNFNGRDELIRLKNQIDYSIFQKSDRIHIGRDGFLFYRDMVDTYVPGLERMPIDTFEARARGLNALGAELAKKHIQLIVMTIPQKFTIYPELLPPTAPAIKDHRRFNDFIGFLQQQPNVILFDATPIMMRLKKEMQVYNRTDFHWAEAAANEVGNELLAMLAKREGMTNFKRHWHPRFGPFTLSGGQAQFMPLIRPPHETAIGTSSQPPGAIALGPPYQWKTNRLPNEPSEFPPAVIIGDSFWWAMYNAGIWHEFSEFYFAHIQDPESPKLYHRLNPPIRYVIVEIIETKIQIDYTPQ